MQDEQGPGWVFKPGDNSQSQNMPPVQPMALDTSMMTQQSSGNEVEWTASEYIANPKSSGWYGLLLLGTVLLAVIGYFITRDVVATSVLVFVGIMFGVFAARQPKTLRYRVGESGVQIGEKFFPYAQFKSFSIAHEHAIAYISLLPLKRFMPPIAIHYEPKDEDRIASTLSAFLPFENHKVDIMDRITKSIRF